MSTEQLYIDPVSCIDCAACVTVCPVGAIHDEFNMPADQEVFKDINAEYFELLPLQALPPAPRPRRTLPDERPVLRVAIIGSGPSGCYAAEELCTVAGVEVSVFDRLPTPFGLVRAGVAPDHQSTKGVTKNFQRVLKRRNVTCYFNVDVGTDITIDELLATHHAVIYSAGADGDRSLGIPGEDLPGSFSARQFVAWYNGHPDHARHAFDLSGQRVVVIGNGNVALDVARVLATSADLLEPTDIAQYAVEALRASGVREVVVAARRGAQDAAYTTSEFMALKAMEGATVVTLPDEVKLEIAANRGQRFGAARRHALAVSASEVEPPESDRRIVFRYMMTPVSINGDETVESVTFARTGDPSHVETIETSLVLRAIGYRTEPARGLPFDEITGTLPNDLGRVIDPATSTLVTGVYCTGWAKRGATGVIGTNKVCSAETVGALLADFIAGSLPDPPRPASDVRDLVIARQPDVLGFAEWSAIDRAELARGQEHAVAKTRLKFHDVAEMLETARL